jgi:exopolysaccharide biosynthesis polyprenyl glycosylphosphotransferase
MRALERQIGMIRENTHLLRRLLLIADLCFVALSFELCLDGYLLVDPRPVRFAFFDSFMLVAAAIWGAMLWSNPQCYSFRGKSQWQVLKAVSSASIKATAILLAFLFYFDLPNLSRAGVAAFIIIGFFSIILGRIVLHILLEFYRKKGYNRQNLIVVGSGKQAFIYVEAILGNPQWGIKPIGFIEPKENPNNPFKTKMWRYNDIPCIGRLEELPGIIKSRQVDWVVYTLDKGELGLIEDSFITCQQMGAKTALLADLFPNVKGRRHTFEFMDHLMLVYDSAPPPNMSTLLKSLIDRAAAAFGLIVLSPLMMLIALAIKVGSKGPVLFKQERIGLNGRRFTMLKFRTMVPDADKLKASLLNKNEMSGPVFKIKDDPRITRLGRVLRKTSSDELPQLVNVLKGDMSLVGPRPPLAEEVNNFDPWQRRKLSVRPGLTCLWQVRGRNNIDFQDWMKMDLEYIDNWSLWLDFRILARTIPAVLSGKGAK